MDINLAKLLIVLFFASGSIMGIVTLATLALLKGKGEQKPSPSQTRALKVRLVKLVLGQAFAMAALIATVWAVATDNEMMMLREKGIELTPLPAIEEDVSLDRPMDKGTPSHSNRAPSAEEAD